MKKKMLLSCVLVLVLVLAASSWATVIVSDDFGDASIDGTKWTVSGNGVSESGGLLNVLKGSVYASYVVSKSTVTVGNLAANETAIITGMNVHYTNSAKGGAFGFCDTAGSFTNCFMLWQDNAGTVTLYMAKNGAAQTKYLMAGNMFHGNFKFTVTAGRAVVTNFSDIAEVVLFDSADPTKNGGISWNIPTAAMGVFMRSSLYNSTYGGTYDSVVMEVVPEPATVALLGFGALSLLKRRK